MLSNDASRAIGPVPAWAVWTHRAVVLISLAFYCFLVYVLVRPLAGTFGFDPWTTIKSLGVVVILGGFVVCLLPLVDLPTIWFSHRRPIARARRGRCPGCGYPRSPLTTGELCPECGATDALPARWQISPQTLLRFVVLLLVAIILGSTLGECWLILDESSFRREASARSYPNPGDYFSRTRSWPNAHSTMTYTLENGPVSDPILASERIRRWMRTE